MHLKESTQIIQENLGTYCRSGQLIDIPGLTPNRVGHYRRLVYNVIDGTLEQAFPLTFQLLDKIAWDKWVNSFFSNAQPQSPQLFKLSYDFYEWSVENNMSEELKMPYLNDLMLFEWLEIEVYTMSDEQIPAYKEEGELLRDILVINPEYRIINIEYPVHLKPVSELSANRGNYFVLVFREPVESKVEFLNLSVFHVYLLERIINAGESLADCLPAAVSQFNMKGDTDITAAVINFFNELKKKGFVLGYRA